MVREGIWGGRLTPFRWEMQLLGIQPVRLPPRCAVRLCRGSSGHTDQVGWDDHGTWDLSVAGGTPVAPLSPHLHLGLSDAMPADKTLPCSQEQWFSGLGVMGVVAAG